MAKDGAKTTEAGVAVAQGGGDPGTPTCLPRLQAGIRTTNDVCGLMSDMMRDSVEGTLTPQLGAVLCAGSRNMLKSAEMRIRYGKPKASDLVLNES